MDYDGLMIKYKYRASPVLTEDERANQLHQNEKVDLGDKKVMDDAAVIHLSSGYMEVVDKWYAVKGFLTVPSLALFLLFTWGVYDFTSTMIYEYLSGRQRDLFFWGFGTGAVIISFLLAWFCSFMMRVECFRWTHYPVRFDRKNRLVHVFSVDGEVYSAPWDDIFFTTGDCVTHKLTKRKNYDIRGHVLAEDRKTVLKTFTLSVSAPRREDLYRNWEFVRRYMEEGPEAVAGVLKLMPPVEGRREGIFFGYWYLMFSATYGAPFFVVPFLMALYLTAWPFRVFAMYTCRIPRWSEEVQASCVIAPDDPWDISAAQNPRSLWRWMLGMDKSHSMVDKKRAMIEVKK
ncbi:DUF6708 domain-containing protein [Klebsiella michiganensis]|uniref:DUF6708 domain-containing protein n=2 Tax=Klebsiella michiganensis TaxID=1134687 RepID=A0ABR5GIW8_9ENTR|nr:DUF6708 domain-containing protein [Klebsiella michiganensis]AUW10428.1 hypothetical protein C2U42_14820 [Klebsiella oxytoca]EWF68090.1 hypothetical protein L387_02464 [Klebsiella michiganensis]KLY41427.1 hypothetical protein SK91_01437 [Klebsiella michiganensis]MBX8833679.1 hypothetical protein [Klebsiella michiganensis]MBX8851967.1 hypothetical protein [Klebsiella michiganensis]